jgi:hypothetical protein
MLTTTCLNIKYSKSAPSDSRDPARDADARHVVKLLGLSYPFRACAISLRTVLVLLNVVQKLSFLTKLPLLCPWNMSEPEIIAKIIRIGTRRPDFPVLLCCK